MRRPEMADEDWEKIKDLLPGKERDAGRTGEDHWLFVNAALDHAASAAEEKKRSKRLAGRGRLGYLISCQRPLRNVTRAAIEWTSTTPTNRRNRVRRPHRRQHDELLRIGSAPFRSAVSFSLALLPQPGWHIRSGYTCFATA